MYTPHHTKVCLCKSCRSSHYGLCFELPKSVMTYQASCSMYANALNTYSRIQLHHSLSSDGASTDTKVLDSKNFQTIRLQTSRLGWTHKSSHSTARITTHCVPHDKSVCSQTVAAVGGRVHLRVNYYESLIK